MKQERQPQVSNDITIRMTRAAKDDGEKGDKEEPIGATVPARVPFCSAVQELRRCPGRPARLLHERSCPVHGDGPERTLG